MSKTKLELTWIGKDKRPRLEPRILLEDPSLSYHAKFRRYSPSPPTPLPEGEGSQQISSNDDDCLSTEGDPDSTAQNNGGVKSPSPSGTTAWMQEVEQLPRGGGERVDIFENKLIFGDNLLALKALEQDYRGKVKCVFIDPPYNTGSAFTHYDDGLEHSIWLSLMRDRLEIIRELLAEDDSLWITIDDNECHYLKVMCDEIFGRRNFIASNIWQKRYSRENREAIGDAHDYILLYAKQAEKFKKLF